MPASGASEAPAEGQGAPGVVALRALSRGPTVVALVAAKAHIEVPDQFALQLGAEVKAVTTPLGQAREAPSHHGNVHFRVVIREAVVVEHGDHLDVGGAVALEGPLAVDAECHAGQAPIPSAAHQVAASAARSRASQLEAQLPVLLEPALQQRDPVVLETAPVADREVGATGFLGIGLGAERGVPVDAHLVAGPLNAHARGHVEGEQLARTCVARTGVDRAVQALPEARVEAPEAHDVLELQGRLAVAPANEELPLCPGRY